MEEEKVTTAGLAPLEFNNDPSGPTRASGAVTGTTGLCPGGLSVAWWVWGWRRAAEEKTWGSNSLEEVL